MLISGLDPKTALVVIDLQKGIAGNPEVHGAEKVLKNASKLADAFRKHRMPVVLVNVSGGAPGRTERKRNLAGMPADWTELVPELNHQPDDHTVTKQTWGAFTNTDLESWLRNQNVTEIVISGISTSAGVESTARFAHELGFNVVLAVDAMTDRSIEAHTNSVERIFPSLGETGTTDQIIALLDKASE